MKFGYLETDYGFATSGMSGYNVGDPIQSFAVQYLYDMMGIKHEDRISVKFCDLNKYDGEYVLLPICGLGIGLKFAKLPLSEKIIPVFISSHFSKTNYSAEEIEYLKKYQPIGCRDEFSLNNLRKYGLDCFLTGCITAIFPKRTELPKEGKVYLIDTPATLEEYLPESIKQKARRGTHLLPLSGTVMEGKEVVDLRERSRKILNEYRDNASLVISSRMHALVPCMAMGIPVIATFENISYRFSWLDKFLKLHTKEDFDKINWNPVPIEYDDIKDKLVNMFSQQILRVYEKYKNLAEISLFYEKREKAKYGNRYSDLLKTIPKGREERFDYIIWGCGLIGNIVNELMKELFPNATLKAAVDRFYKGEKWNNVTIIRPDKLGEFDNCYIVLSTFSGKADGYERMTELGKIENKDFIYVATQNG